MLVILISASSVWASDSYSQNTQLKLSATEGTIESIFNQISKQSRLEFFYNTNILNAKEKVSLSIKQGTLDEILKEIDLCVVRNIHIYGISGLSLQNGIVGLGRYMLIRILPTFVSVDTSSSALLKEYLIYLIDWLEEELKHSDESVEDILDFLFELYPTGFYRTKVSALIDCCMSK